MFKKGGTLTICQIVLETTTQEKQCFECCDFNMVSIKSVVIMFLFCNTSTFTFEI